MCSRPTDSSTRLAVERPLPSWVLDTMPAQSGSQPHLDYVIDAIEALAPRQREVIEALFFERLTERPLARRLGLSRNTIKTHKRRALTNLKRELEDVR